MQKLAQDVEALGYVLWTEPMDDDLPESERSFLVTDIMTRNSYAVGHFAEVRQWVDRMLAKERKELAEQEAKERKHLQACGHDEIVEDILKSRFASRKIRLGLMPAPELTF